MGVDFDIFDDEPSKSVGQPPSPKAAPTSVPTLDDIDVHQLETTSPTKEALFNAETQERIDQAKAKAKEHAKLAAATSAHLARQGGKKAMEQARKVLAYRPRPVVFKPSPVLVKAILAGLVLGALTWAVVHHWPASKGGAAAPIGKESVKPEDAVSSTAAPDVETPTPVQADKTIPHAEPVTVEQVDAALATKAPEAPKQPLAPVGHVTAQRAKSHTTPTPKPTTQQKDEPTSDWKQKANDEMDAYFKELNNKE